MRTLLRKEDRKLFFVLIVAAILLLFFIFFLKFLALAILGEIFVVMALIRLLRK